MGRFEENKFGMWNLSERNPNAPKTQNIIIIHFADPDLLSNDLVIKDCGSTTPAIRVITVLYSIRLSQTNLFKFSVFGIIIYENK